MQAGKRSDEFAGSAPRFIPHAVAQKLSRLKSTRSLLQIAWEWLAVGSSLMLTEHFWNPFIYVLAIMWIGARQHALGILMHDAAHGTLLRSRRWNDRLGEILLAWPLFMTLHGYRRNHLAHHRHLNTDQDPDWMTTQGPEFNFPKSPFALFCLLLRDLLGLRIAYLLFRIRQYGGKGTAAPGLMGPTRLLLYALGVLIFFVRPDLFRLFLMYWLVPALTWVGLITHLRIIGEHYALPRTHFLNKTRTTLANRWERLFVAPNNIHFHLEHHLYPSVPWYHLPDLHHALMEHAGFRDQAHITRGYWRLIGECVRADPVICEEAL